MIENSLAYSFFSLVDNKLVVCQLTFCLYCTTEPWLWFSHPHLFPHATTKAFAKVIMVIDGRVSLVKKFE